MSDFELVLDECLAQLANGGSSLDEILARHPEYAAQLRPLLQPAAQFDVARNMKPSPVFKARARGQLTNYMQAHPRRKAWMVSPFWRAAISLAVLVVLFLATGTAFAQSALPGQALYAWKLSSENIWRAVAPNPVAVDLTLADQRVSEVIAVTGDPAQEAQALNGYLEVLGRLKSENDALNNNQIMQALKSQQGRLKQSGISVPQLDQILSPSSIPVAPTAPSTAPALPSLAPNILPTSVPSLLPNIISTLKIPPLLP